MLRMQAFWDVMMWHWVIDPWYFEGTCHLWLQKFKVHQESSAFMDLKPLNERERSSETSGITQWCSVTLHRTRTVNYNTVKTSQLATHVCMSLSFSLQMKLILQKATHFACNTLSGTENASYHYNITSHCKYTEKTLNHKHSAAPNPKPNTENKNIHSSITSINTHSYDNHPMFWSAPCLHHLLAANQQHITEHMIKQLIFPTSSAFTCSTTIQTYYCLKTVWDNQIYFY
jgi:hypothetical protein